ncbi:hypothetical protein PIROE2DRAFT_10926, partial [Piromyces sp. E2]
YLNSLDLNEEDIKELLSFNTITSLSYYKSYDIKGIDTELKLISNLKNLKELILQGFEIDRSDITEEGIKLISQLTNLEKLCDFEDRVVSLKPLENLKKLKEFTMYNVNIIKEFPSNIPSLNYLNIHDMILTQEQFNAITSLTNLNELSLNGRNIESKMKEIPESIFTLSKLTNL